MSAAVLEAGASLLAEEDRQSRLFDDLRRDPPVERPSEGDSNARPEEARGEPRPRSGGDRMTLEAHLERSWEGLLVAGVAECPVCGDLLEWSEPGGSCRGCGSALR